MNIKTNDDESVAGELDLAAWSHEPGETDEHFDAFRVYLKQEPPRKVAIVATQMQQKRGKIYLWSKKHRWIERAMRWDNAVAQMEGAELADQRLQLTLAHMRMLGKLRIVAEHNIDRLLMACTEDCDKDAKISTKTLIMLLEKIVHYERLIVGDVTDRTQTDAQIDVTRLTEDELLQIKAIEAKIAQK